MHRRTPLALIAALALLASLAFAAPASAASAEMGTISDVSYTTAHVTGKVTTADIYGIGGSYYFEYSTDETNWNTGLSGTYGGVATKKTVQGTISVPKGATKYFVRLRAFSLGDGEAFSPAPYPSFTTLAVDPPVVTATDDASAVFSTSATATGKVKRPANSDSAFDVTSCRFEYVTDAQFTATGFNGAVAKACEGFTSITAPNDEKTVNAHLTGLSLATTYHLRLAAENAAPNAATKEAAHTFTTAPTVAKPTVLATDNAFEVAKRSAKASGEVERPAGGDPELDVNCRFEFVTDAQFTATGFAGASQAPCGENPITSPSLGHPAVTAEVTAILFGLLPSTTYHLRLAAENGGGTDTKDAASTFTTLAAIAPKITVDSITEVGYISAHLSGTIDPGNEGVLGWVFQYYSDQEAGGTGSPGSSNGPEYSVGPNSPPTSVSTDLPCTGYYCTPLKPGTTYKVRIVGVNMDEWPAAYTYIFSEAPDPEFTTKGTSAPPLVSLDPVSAITATTAHFSGTVDANAPSEPLPPEVAAVYETDWHFECTPECAGLPGGIVKADEGAKTISVDTNRLHANTYYDEVKLVAHNYLGTVETPVQAFQTPLVPADVKSAPGGSDGKGGYTLEGVINSNNSKLTSCQFEYGTTATYPNTYKIPCLPSPSGPDEVQQVNVDATEGQFKLSFRGQSTTDLPYNATPAAVQTVLRALPSVAPSGVVVTGSAGAYVVTFAGKLAGANVEQLKASNGTTPLGGGGGAGVSTSAEGGKNGPVTVEARLEGLTIGATYHFRIFATNAAGTASSPDRTFVPTLAPPSPECPNEQLRKESLSLALPECRAYEEITVGIDAEREGNSTAFDAYAGGGDTVAYSSGASNIANSGTGALLGALGYNVYVAKRTAAGWETIRNLNGPPGTTRYSPPEFYRGGDVLKTIYSADLLSSIWPLARKRDDPPGAYVPYLRKPDGSFHQIGPLGPSGADRFVGASADFSHSVWGPGPAYEFVGTGNDQPRRVDLDNFGDPIGPPICNSTPDAISLDGSTIVLTALIGCGAQQVWARVDGTTSYDLSASRCTRTAADPGGACNAPADVFFQFATPDGSHVFFTTTQQLVNGDTDKTHDLYVCDLPTTPQAPIGSSNPCAALTEVSGAADKAKVEQVLSTREVGTSFGGPSKVISDDGSTAYFTAEGVLADNTDPLGEEAVAGDRNLYVWRRDAGHPAGQTTFIARLPENNPRGETTPDGRYLAFQTYAPLVPTDTDNAGDIYRYDAVTGEMIRASTGISGTGGNAEGFSAGFTQLFRSKARFNPRINISAAGDRIVFNTNEALSPLDGNGAGDVYLWSSGHVYLISGGSVGNGGANAVISDSGRDIYFDSPNGGDVIDARIGGGFSPPPTPCSGESCQPAAASPPAFRAPSSEQQGSGNPPEPKGCPKGKVKKQGKCVKKPSKKHQRKSSHKRAGSNGGGGK